MIKKLRPEDHRLHGLILVIKHLVEDDLTAARTELDAIRDDSDSRWWQLYAQLCQQNGDEDSAQDAWARASELLAHPDILRRSVKASLDRRKYGSAVRGLLKLLKSDPKNTQHLNNIACRVSPVGKLVGGEPVPGAAR